MPAKSPKQYRFMAGIAHGMTSNKGIGPSPEVAEEMVKKTPPKKRSLFMRKKKKPMMDEED
jgi:hypothetical protein